MNTRPDLDALGRFLRERRRERQLTQAQLAERLGWTQERVSILENGKYGMPSITALAALARALECPLSELLRAVGFDDEQSASATRHRVGEEGGEEHYYALQRLFGVEATSLGTALKEAAVILADVMSADKVDALLYDPETASLVTLGSSNTPIDELQRGGSVVKLPRFGAGHEVEVMETGTPYRSAPALDDSNTARVVSDALGVQSVIMVPLDMGGARRGVLVAESSRQDHFVPADLSFLETLAGWVGIIAHRAEVAAGAIGQALEQAQQPLDWTEPPEGERRIVKEHAGPTVLELQGIVERLDRDVAATPFDRSALLMAEMTLRGMLPTLEALLQYAVIRHSEGPDLVVADHAIMILSQHLEWIQLHAHAPVDVIGERVRDSIMNAAAALDHFTR